MGTDQIALGGRRLRILFVDDEEDVLSMCTSILLRLGHSVRGETDGREALRVFAEAPDEFDLAVLDYVMPGLTGLELGARLRCIKPYFPIIVYTGYVDAATIGEIESFGIGQVVSKPMTSEEWAGILAGPLGGELA